MQGMGRAGRDLQFVSKEVMACDARDTGRVTDNSKVLCRSGSHISRCCVINQGTKKREEVLGETWMDVCRGYKCRPQFIYYELIKVARIMTTPVQVTDLKRSNP